MRSGAGAMSATLLAMLVVTGCAPGATSPSKVAGTQAPGASGESAPSHLTFATDPDRVAAGTVSFLEGGTVTATAEDGTTFTLDVPPFAVSADTEITLTPLLDVEGYPAEPTAIFAVQMSPEGLTFHEPARLTIVPATPIPVEEQLALESAGDGSDLALALVDPNEEDLVILVEHFSTAQLGQFPPNARQAMRQRAAANAEGRIENQVRDALQAERIRQLNGEAPDVTEAEVLESVDAEYRREVLGRLRANANESCFALKAYVDKALSWEKQRQLAGLAQDSDALADLGSFIQSRYDACEKEAIRECREAKKPAILVDFWLAMARSIGVAAPEAGPQMQEEARRRCLAQDYRIDKTLEVTQMNLTVNIRYTATKCGGHEGTWTIDSAGTLSGYGGSADITSPITLEIPAGSTEGTFTGVARYEDDIGGQTEGIFSGRATFIEEPATLELEITDGRYGTGNGYRWGFHDDGFTGPGSLTFPLEAGDFCD